MQNFRRILAAIACLVVAVASFALSYVALSEVAVSLGAVPAGMGWLVPIVIDGGIICGSAVIWSLSKEQTKRPKFPFFFVGAMVIMSVVVNIAHAGEEPLAKVIAALPPLILLGTLELVADQGRRDRLKKTPEVPVEELKTSEEPTTPVSGFTPVVEVAPELEVPKTEVVQPQTAKEVSLPVQRPTRAAAKPSTSKTVSKTSTKPASAKPATKASATRTAKPRIVKAVEEVETPSDLSSLKETAEVKVPVAAMKEERTVRARVTPPPTGRVSSTKPLRVSAAAPVEEEPLS